MIHKHHRTIANNASFNFNVFNRFSSEITTAKLFLGIVYQAQSSLCCSVRKQNSYGCTDDIYTELPITNQRRTSQNSARTSYSHGHECRYRPDHCVLQDSMFAIMNELAAHLPRSHTAQREYVLHLRLML